MRETLVVWAGCLGVWDKYVWMWTQECLYLDAGVVAVPSGIALSCSLRASCSKMLVLMMRCAQPKMELKAHQAPSSRKTDDTRTRVRGTQPIAASTAPVALSLSFSFRAPFHLLFTVGIVSSSCQWAWSNVSSSCQWAWSNAFAVVRENNNDLYRRSHWSFMVIKKKEWTFEFISGRVECKFMRGTACVWILFCVRQFGFGWFFWLEIDMCVDVKSMMLCGGGPPPEVVVWRDG